MLPNAEHTMVTGILDLLPAATTWAIGVMAGKAAPKFTWTVSPTDGSITINVDPANKPDRVTLYNVTTLDNVRRDFRLISGDTTANPCKYIKVDVFGPACLRPLLWLPYDVNATTPGGTTYVLPMQQPPAGFWNGILGACAARCGGRVGWASGFSCVVYAYVPPSLRDTPSQFSINISTPLLCPWPARSQVSFTSRGRPLGRSTR